MNRIIRQVELLRANRKADKSVSLTFVTDLEQTTEEFMEIDENVQTRGILYYSQRGQLTQQEVDELDNVDIELEGKTKSQRLRAVLFIEWKQNGEQGEFKDFYADRMEKIIQHYKDRLEYE